MGLNAFMTRLAAILALLAIAAGSHAAAQDFESYQQRQRDLVGLAAVFGDLHHVRRYCDPRAEADVWRERMKKIIELEAPLAEAREEMVAAFNRSYRSAQRRFPRCDRRARDYAAARAAQGDEIVNRLKAPLYEAMEQETSPFAVGGAPETSATIDPIRQR